METKRRNDCHFCGNSAERPVYIRLRGKTTRVCGMACLDAVLEAAAVERKSNTDGPVLVKRTATPDLKPKSTFGVKQQPIIPLLPLEAMKQYSLESRSCKSGHDHRFALCFSPA